MAVVTTGEKIMNPGKDEGEREPRTLSARVVLEEDSVEGPPKSSEHASGCVSRGNEAGVTSD